MCLVAECKCSPLQTLNCCSCLLSIVPPDFLIVSGALCGSTVNLFPPACRHVRTLNLPANAAAQLLTLAHQQGKLVAHSWQDLALHLFTCNGRHVTTAEGNEKLNALVVSNDGRFLLTGGTKGCITLRWLHSLQV